MAGLFATRLTWGHGLDGNVDFCNCFAGVTQSVARISDRSWARLGRKGSRKYESSGEPLPSQRRRLERFLAAATESVFTTTDVGATEAVYSKATAVARQAVAGGSRWTPAGGLAIGSAQLEYVQANSDGTAVASFVGTAPAVDQFAIVLRRRDLATRATPTRTSATDIDSGTAEFIAGYEDVLDIAVVNPNECGSYSGSQVGSFDEAAGVVPSTFWLESRHSDWFRPIMGTGNLTGRANGH